MKEPKIVALNRFGPLSSAVRFKTADATFGRVVKRGTPALKNLEEFSDTSDFNSLSSSDKNQKILRNFALLPPRLVLAFLPTPLRLPSDLTRATKAASEKFKNSFRNHAKFNEDTHNEDLEHICSLMRPSCYRKKLRARVP